MSVSILILTLNEERNLGGCLESAAWSDDVVVLDSYSTDRTTSIARAAGARSRPNSFRPAIELGRLYDLPASNATRAGEDTVDAAADLGTDPLEVGLPPPPRPFHALASNKGGRRDRPCRSAFPSSVHRLR